MTSHTRNIFWLNCLRHPQIYELCGPLRTHSLFVEHYISGKKKHFKEKRNSKNISFLKIPLSDRLGSLKLSSALSSLSVHLFPAGWWRGCYDDNLPGARTGWHPGDWGQGGSRPWGLCIKSWLDLHLNRPKRSLCWRTHRIHLHDAACIESKS